MRIGLIQLNAKIGDFEQNRLRIQSLAESGSADLYLCPELCLSGYHCRDLFTRREFLAEDQRQLQLLMEWSRGARKSLWVGHTLLLDEGTADEALYNAASLICDGRVVQRSLKRQLPNYNIFDEKRYFTAGTEVSEFTDFRGTPMRAEICEDSWKRVQRFAVDEWLRYPPAPEATRPKGASTTPLLVNLSASPFVIGKAHTRRELLARTAQESRSIVAYANFVGAQDEITFDGQSSVYTSDGTCLFEAPGFAEGLFVVDLGAKPQATRAPERGDWEDLRLALTGFVRDYVAKTGFGQVAIGLSGGIDSALCAALCVDALGSENVLGVGLSTRWTTDLSRNEAESLARNLGIEYRHLHIEEGLEAVRGVVGASLTPLSEENLQARFRGLALMTLVNNERRLLISTSNKSEIAMGYSTLYGDMCGAIMPIGDLYKTEVYGLAHHLNARAGTSRIPPATLSRPPTAELAPGQRDSDSLPDYARLDAFLWMYLEHRERLTSETKAWDEFLAPYTVSELVRRVQRNEFKRVQSPLVAKVHLRSFGKHWQMPVAKAIGPTLY